MKYFDARYWSVFDIACLKWSSILFGVIVGAYCSEFVQANVWAFVVACVVLGLHPAYRFFRPAAPSGTTPHAPAAS